MARRTHQTWTQFMPSLPSDGSSLAGGMGGSTASCCSLICAMRLFAAGACSPDGTLYGVIKSASSASLKKLSSKLRMLFCGSR